MKRIAALMISGFLASAAALAQDSKMAAPAPATPAATSPSGAAPEGDQATKKKAHRATKKKAHKAMTDKTAAAKTEGDMKKSADTKSAAAPAATPMAPAPK